MTTGSSKTAIEVEGLSKLYRRTAAGHRLRTLKSALLERITQGSLVLQILVGIVLGVGL